MSIEKNPTPETVFPQPVGELCRPTGTIFALVEGRRPRYDQAACVGLVAQSPTDAWCLVPRKSRNCPLSLSF